jgi:hypothetical protein
LRAHNGVTAYNGPRVGEWVENLKLSRVFDPLPLVGDALEGARAAILEAEGGAGNEVLPGAGDEYSATSTNAGPQIGSTIDTSLMAIETSHATNIRTATTAAAFPVTAPGAANTVASGVPTRLASAEGLMW